MASGVNRQASYLLPTLVALSLVLVAWQIADTGRHPTLVAIALVLAVVASMLLIAVAAEARGVVGPCGLGVAAI